MNSNYKSSQSLAVGDTFIRLGKVFTVTGPVVPAEPTAWSRGRFVVVPVEGGTVTIALGAPVALA